MSSRSVVATSTPSRFQLHDAPSRFPYAFARSTSRLPANGAPVSLWTRPTAGAGSTVTVAVRPVTVPIALAATARYCAVSAGASSTSVSPLPATAPSPSYHVTSAGSELSTAARSTAGCP